ncbi:14917_t:CDS:2, partial [Racocetra persica]
WQSALLHDKSSSICIQITQADNESESVNSLENDTSSLYSVSQFIFTSKLLPQMPNINNEKTTEIGTLASQLTELEIDEKTSSDEKDKGDKDSFIDDENKFNKTNDVCEELLLNMPSNIENNKCHDRDNANNGRDDQKNDKNNQDDKNDQKNDNGRVDKNDQKD